jgi:uncharacterized protein (DUF488 family)
VPTIWTIGYELLMPEPLVAELEAAGIERLLDVRFRPQSRRPGMSKTRLAARLGEADIAYEHRRALGTPPDLRALYRAGRIEEAATGYRRHVEAHAAPELDELAEDIAGDAPPTALLCLEAEPATCHRREITEALRRRVPDLEVIDL